MKVVIVSLVVATCSSVRCKERLMGEQDFAADALVSTNSESLNAQVGEPALFKTMEAIPTSGSATPSTAEPSSGGDGSASLAADTAATSPPMEKRPRGRSPLSVFSPGSVFIPTANTFFTEKKVRSYFIEHDTYYGGVFIPAGSTLRQAEYDVRCSAQDCINLNVMTPEQIAQVHDKILNRGNEISRLDPQNYMAQRGSAQRQVWRWSFLGDDLPIPPENIDLYRAAGVSIIPTLQADNPAYRDQRFPGNGPCMTADITDEFDSAFGYSRLYFDWVTRLVTTYADIMPMITIENEVDQDGNTWCEPTGVRAGYRKMVVTAKYAIQQAGVNVLVADSGMMGDSWIRLTLVDLVAERAAIVEHGQPVPPELEHQILELISQIATEIPLTQAGDVDWAAIENATTKMNTLPMQNAREVIRLLNADVIDPDLGEPVLDVYNFHYHQTSSAMPAVAQYIPRVFDTNGSPLINNEMGLLADQDNKTLASNNTSLLEFTEFMPVSSYFPTGEIEGTGGVEAFGARVPIPPREELLATEDLVKKFIHAFGNGVSDVTYFGFNGRDRKSSIYHVLGGQPYDFFKYEWIDFASSITEDKIIVPQNFRAILNLRALFDRTILSTAHNVAEPVESYKFELPHKTVTVWWVQAYVSNIGLILDVDVSAQIAAGAHFYDMEGFEIAPQAGKIQVGFSPIFAERMLFPGDPLPAAPTLP